MIWYCLNYSGFTSIWRREMWLVAIPLLLCWRHYLKEVKFESFWSLGEGVNIHDLMKHYNVTDLMDAWALLPLGMLLCQLDWCSPEGVIENVNRKRFNPWLKIQKKKAKPHQLVSGFQNRTKICVSVDGYLQACQLLYNFKNSSECKSMLQLF